MSDSQAYATPTDNLQGKRPTNPLEDLSTLRSMLVSKRRQLVSDAMIYQAVYIGRSQDVVQVQSMIEALDRAIQDELRLTDAGKAPANQ